MSLNLPFKNINEFDLVEIIQEGPYTIVLQGYQKNLNRSVLIKLLKPHSSNELKKRFNREARVYAKLNHPNIVSVYALGEIKNYLYIILEFIHGYSLKTILESEDLPLSVIWEIGHFILEALQHASKNNVIHRDIKPANIMIDMEGNIKVTDFGLALIEDEPEITKQQALIGTPAYMSPEQITGDRLDIRSDIFALGALLFELVYKKQAFGGESYSGSINNVLNDMPVELDRNDNIPESINHYIKKCLEKNRKNRWRNINEAIDGWQNLKNIFMDDKEEINLKSVVDNLNNVRIQHTLIDSKLPAKRKYLNKTLPIIFVIIILTAATLIFYPDNNEPKQNNISINNITGKLPDLKNRSNTENISKKKPKEAVVSSQSVSLNSNRIISPQPPVENDSVIAVPVPEKAVLKLSIIPWAKVFLNATLIDTHMVHRSLTLEAAEYTLTFQHPGFAPETQKIRLSSGKEKVIHWSFFKKTGFLYLQVRPWADVYIDDEYYDTTPLKKPLRIPAGRKILELRHPVLKNYREVINIAEGDTLFIKRVLVPENGTIIEK